MGHSESLLIIWNLLAFLLMLFIVRYALWPKLYYFIEARRIKIESLQKSYERRNKEVADLAEKMKDESSKAAQRRKKILTDTKKESIDLKKEIMFKAHNEASSIIEKAKVEIHKEKTNAFEEVRKDVSMIVAKAIKQVLYNIVDEDLDKRVMEEIKKVVSTVE